MKYSAISNLWVNKEIKGVIPYILIKLQVINNTHYKWIEVDTDVYYKFRATLRRITSSFLKGDKP